VKLVYENILLKRLTELFANCSRTKLWQFQYFYMAVKHGHRERDWNRIQAAEAKYLRTGKGCTRLDQIRNKDIRNELGISP
jgi:hypothetical protein